MTFVDLSYGRNLVRKEVEWAASFLAHTRHAAAQAAHGARAAADRIGRQGRVTALLVRIRG